LYILLNLLYNILMVSNARI